MLVPPKRRFLQKTVLDWQARHSPAKPEFLLYSDITFSAATRIIISILEKLFRGLLHHSLPIEHATHQHRRAKARVSYTPSSRGVEFPEKWRFQVPSGLVPCECSLISGIILGMLLIAGLSTFGQLYAFTQENSACEEGGYLISLLRNNIREAPPITALMGSAFHTSQTSAHSSSSVALSLRSL